jgi:hypothetical protein
MEEAEIADNDDSAGAAHGQASGQTLEHGWAFWLVSPQVEAGGKVASERTVHTFSTVDEFWRFYPHFSLVPQPLASSKNPRPMYSRFLGWLLVGGS